MPVQKSFLLISKGQPSFTAVPSNPVVVGTQYIGLRGRQSAPKTTTSHNFPTPENVSFFSQQIKISPNILTFGGRDFPMLGNS